MNIQYINDINVCSNCFSPSINYKHRKYVYGISIKTGQLCIDEIIENETSCFICGNRGLSLNAKLIQHKKGKRPDYYLLVNNTDTFIICELRLWHLKQNDGDKVLIFDFVSSPKIIVRLYKNEITKALYNNIFDGNVNLTSALESFWALVSSS